MPAEVESMAYYGDIPWHRFGEQVDAPLTGDEMLTASGTNWLVEKHALRVYDQYYNLAVHDHFAIVRPWRSQGEQALPSSVLGIVGCRYTPIQNKEAVEFAEALIGEGQAVYHTGGSLQGGKKVWYLLKLEGDLNLPAEDRVDRYVLVTNSHDGSSCLQCAVTPIRVVCMNTLNLALNRAEQRFSVAHRSHYRERVGEARRALGLVEHYYRSFQDISWELAGLKMTSSEVSAFLNELIPVVNESPVAQRHQSEIRRLFGGAGLGLEEPGIYGTRWAMLNAVGEWTDHVRPARVIGVASPSDLEIAEARLRSIWYGSGRILKNRALDLLAN